jgi:hypothetical protein
MNPGLQLVTLWQGTAYFCLQPSRRRLVIINNTRGFDQRVLFEDFQNLVNEIVHEAIPDTFSASPSAWNGRTSRPASHLPARERRFRFPLIVL